MARNLEKDAREMAERDERILQAGFRIFAKNTIERVTMNDVAREAGVGIATLYRYYNSKPALVIAISTKAWEEYIVSRGDVSFDEKKTAKKNLEFYLESFLDLYRNHKDILRFNQFFNVYVQSEALKAPDMKSYNKMIHGLAERFHHIYLKAEQDKTLRTDRSETEMFSTVTHLMLAAVTRYAVGLVYNEGTDPEKELELQKEMLLKAYSTK